MSESGSQPVSRPSPEGHFSPVASSYMNEGGLASADRPQIFQDQEFIDLNHSHHFVPQESYRTPANKWPDTQAPAAMLRGESKLPEQQNNELSDSAKNEENSSIQGGPMASPALEPPPAPSSVHHDHTQSVGDNVLDVSNQSICRKSDFRFTRLISC